MQMRFLPDEPIRSTVEDLLKFGDFAELVQHSINNAATPFVFGVLGDWGAGKTSVLRLIENRFEEDLKDPKPDKVVCVPIWFNPWEYENEVNLVYPLLHAIKQSYDKRIELTNDSRHFGRAFKTVVATSILAVSDGILRMATKLALGDAVGLKDIREHLDLVEEKSDDLEAVLNSWADNVGKLRTAFQGLLDAFATDLAQQDTRIQADSVRFVILLDDLDRCLPDTTIRILESIKHTLTVKRCVFVLALNARVVYQGIGSKYQNAGVDGREYLEKILNYTFYVPEPELDRVRTFARNRIKELVPGLESLEHTARTKLTTSFDDFGRVLEECRFNNPRKIKRILNRYLLFLSQPERNLDDYFLPNVVRLIVMAEYFPSLFQLFVNDAEAARRAAATIGKAEFQIKPFEDHYGVALVGIYPQLSIMRELFNVQPQPDINKPSLQHQVNDVYALTRLV